jgi:lipopolysaccharide export system protein LptA
MKTSIAVKLMIAVFLGAFIWFVIVSIQTPRKKPVAQETVELREELLNRAEGVTVEVGDVRIEAAVQETYRNMEVHYQGFTMTRETKARKMVVTGKTAQMKSEGSDVSFVEMEGNVHVETDDGLILDSETLNYEEVQKRIFSNTPVTFSLNNLSGKSQVFIYYTEQRLLHMHGRVDCILLLDEEPGTEKGPRKRVRIRCKSLDYDQENHLLTLEGNVKVAQAGSYLMGSRLEADLTEDNKQFLQMRIFDSETREIPAEPEGTEDETAEAEAEAETEESEEPDPKSGISYHAGGIKNLKAKELTLDFKVGPGNPMEKVTATDKARLHIAPTSRQITMGKTDEKKISGDVITAFMGEDGKGIKTINVLSRDEDKKAKMDIRPSQTIRPRKQKGQKRKKSEREQNLKKPRIITAKEFNAKVDEETGEVSEVVMTGGTKMEQGDLEITGRSGRYIAAEEQLNIEGSPVLVDKVKRVTGRRMVVSLDIGDLTAEGKVRSIFSPTKRKKGDNVGIFSIAGGNSQEQETIISSDTLQFDYKKNILRYDKSVRVTQGDTNIKCDNLTIMQNLPGSLP